VLRCLTRWIRPWRGWRSYGVLVAICCIQRKIRTHTTLTDLQTRVVRINRRTVVVDYLEPRGTTLTNIRVLLVNVSRDFRFLFANYHKRVLRDIRGVDVLGATRRLPIGPQRQRQRRHENTDNSYFSDHKAYLL